MTYLLFLLTLSFSSSLFAANCGGSNQVPCTVFQRDIVKFGSCDKGLKEDFGKNRCVAAGPPAAPLIQAHPRPANCGRNDQPPCPLSIHYTPCEAPNQLYLGNGRCMSPQAIQAEEGRKTQRPGNCGRQGQPACAPSPHYTRCEAPNVFHTNGTCNPRPTRPENCGRQNQPPCVASPDYTPCEGPLQLYPGSRTCMSLQDIQAAENQKRQRPANCGRQDQRPCTINEYVPSCESGLHESGGGCRMAQKPAPMLVTRPHHCGHQLQRPCAVTEFVPSCEGGLREANGQCVSTASAAPQPAALTPPPAAQLCANEDQDCAFNGTADVYFGAQSSWTVQAHTNGVSCSNAVFGDPIPGVSKSCLVVLTQPEFVAPLETAAPPVEPYVAPAVLMPPPNARLCAVEKLRCEFSGERVVYFGAQESWTAQTHVNGVSCSKAVFGDPIPGVFKTCRIVPPQADTTTQAPAAVESEPQRPTKSVPRPVENVTLHEHCDFKGEPVKLGPGRYDAQQLQARGLKDNTLSSLRVPQGFVVLLFDADQSRSRPLEVRDSLKCLASENFDNVVSSITIRSLKHVTLYLDCFRGVPKTGQDNEEEIKRSLLLEPGRYLLHQLQEMGFRNDDLSAIRIPPGLEVQLFEHDGFQGRSLKRTETSLCLESDGFDNMASSIVVAKAGTLSQMLADPVPGIPVVESQRPLQPPPLVEERFGCHHNEQWRWTAAAMTVESDPRSCTPGAAVSYWTIQGVTPDPLRATGVTDDKAGLLTLTVDNAGQRLSLQINNIRSTVPNSAEFRYGIASDSPVIGTGKWERFQR
jgi:hypothetical protein